MFGIDALFCESVEKHSAVYVFVCKWENYTLPLKIASAHRTPHTQTHHYIAHFSFSNCLSPSTNTELKWLIFDSPAYAHTYKQAYIHPPTLVHCFPYFEWKNSIYVSGHFEFFKRPTICYSKLQIVHDGRALSFKSKL